MQTILKGLTTPLKHWCKLFCVCAGTLDLTRFSYWIDTLVLKLREILTARVLHHPFLFKGKTNASPISVNVSISGAVVCGIALDKENNIMVMLGYICIEVILIWILQHVLLV